jgi:hypothetical protein
LHKKLEEADEQNNDYLNQLREMRNDRILLMKKINETEDKEKLIEVKKIFAFYFHIIFLFFHSV